MLKTLAMLPVVLFLATTSLAGMLPGMPPQPYVMGADFDSHVAEQANDSNTGHIQTATAAQATTGTNDSVALVPSNIGSISHNGLANVKDANDTVSGHIQTATDAQTAAGTNDSVAVTPAGLASVGFITAVSNDTTPQAGGNLDMQSFNIDNAGIVDADRYKSGSGSVINKSENDSVDAAYDGAFVQIGNDSPDNMRLTWIVSEFHAGSQGIFCPPDKDLTLYYDITGGNFNYNGTPLDDNDALQHSNDSRECIGWIFNDSNTCLIKSGQGGLADAGAI